MKSVIILCGVAVAITANSAAQTPAIAAGPAGVVNNANYAPSGLPNAGIAQGSIFAIFGTNLGPASLQQQPSYPLNKNLAGTSVKVTVNGTTVDAIPIYTVSSQVGAVLASNTPIGTGTVTLTYNGQTSAPHPIEVVANSFGSFSLNQKGSGPAVVTDVNYSPFTLTNAAAPNQTIIIWGTGLGAISGDDAATPNPKDLTNIPVEVLIGGKTAPLRYRGRSGCCAGLDQIVADIPSGLSGCYTSLIVKINNTVSNASTIPVAASGKVCSDSNGFAGTDLEAALAKGEVRIGFLGLGRQTTKSSLPPLPNPIPGFGDTTTDDAFGGFYKYTPQQFTASQGLFRQASFGSCVVTTVSFDANSNFDPVLPVALDAGPSIAINGPNGTKQMSRDGQFGFYSADLGGSNGTPLYIPNAGGTFTFMGTGGADVGPFNASISLAAPLVWTNIDSITDVQRLQGQTVTWTGGDPSTYVVISGTSTTVSTGSESGSSVTFSCTAPVNPGTFTVPSAVLLGLPVSQTVEISGVTIGTGALSVSNYTLPKKFTAPGLDQAYLDAYVTSAKTVNYK